MTPPMIDPAVSATASAAPGLASSSIRPPRWRRWVGRTGMMLGGLCVGLVISELAFRARADGAFPHLNIYVPDAELGVRLEPGGSQRVRLGVNPVTSVRINAAGYRGAALPAPGADDVLVVGDSQVFGLGVEEDQTFSARLQATIKRTVVNGGVPTYGPDEYRAVIAEQLATRKPKTVVLTINLVNDLFEVGRPNKDRHAVWDGWAVRKETAPASVTWFPGRDFMYRRSHLVYALRKWWHDDDRLDGRGFASEGGWTDLVASGEREQTQRAAIGDAQRKRRDEVAKLQRELVAAEDGIDEALRDLLNEAGDSQLPLQMARAHPGDIVEDHAYEGSRPIVVTAELIRSGAIARAKLRTELATWAKARRDPKAVAAVANLDARGTLLARLTEVEAQKLEAALDPPLGVYIRDVQQLVEGAGARLVVVILPIDVQVSATEWKKYGATPIDMTPTLAITAELVTLCASLGVTALDATPVLAAALPGAFLDRDIHMTAKGHAALAAALATTLATPAPPRRVASERSPVPVPAVWHEVPEVIVTGSTAAGCETKRVREWLRVMCGRTETATPRSIEIQRDDGNESLAIVMPQEMSLVIPIVEGRETIAKLSWTDQSRILRVAWPAGAAKPTLAFAAAEKIASRQPVSLYEKRTFVSPVERTICDCWNRFYGGPRYGRGASEVFECSGVYGASDAACTATYAPLATADEEQTRGQCGKLLACIWRDPASPP